MTSEEALEILENLKYQFDDRIAESEYSKDKDLLEALESNKTASEALEMAIKTLEQQPCEDLVSRECNNCAYYVNGANDEACDGCFADEYEHPNFKPKAQHCDDCISRQAVLDINEHHHGQMPNHVNHEIWKEIKALHSVTPKEKTGKWIKDELGTTICSVCKKPRRDVRIGHTNYCNSCGAEMVGDTE